MVIIATNRKCQMLRHLLWVKRKVSRWIKFSYTCKAWVTYQIKWWISQPAIPLFPRCDHVWIFPNKYLKHCGDNEPNSRDNHCHKLYITQYAKRWEWVIPRWQHMDSIRRQTQKMVLSLDVIWDVSAECCSSSNSSQKTMKTRRLPITLKAYLHKEKLMTVNTIY